MRLLHKAINYTSLIGRRRVWIQHAFYNNPVQKVCYLGLISQCVRMNESLKAYFATRSGTMAYAILNFDLNTKQPCYIVGRAAASRSFNSPIVD
jgi:hypothetical protein